MLSPVPVILHNNRDIEYILDVIKYKKSTIASLKSVLDHFKIENELAKHLNSSSNYGELGMEALYETVS